MLFFLDSEKAINGDSGHVQQPARRARKLWIYFQTWRNRDEMYVVQTLSQLSDIVFIIISG